MTEATSPNSSTTAAIEGEKLWAGKYKTPEEMEAALQGKDKEYVKLKQTHEALQKTHVAPDNYTVPDHDNLLENQIENLKLAAKTANLSQEGFEKLVSELTTTERLHKEKYDEKLKVVGAENIVVLEDYVKKHYPESLHKTVLKQLVNDDTARAEAMKHRDQLLNSRAPGMSEGNSGAEKPSEKYDGQAELLKLAKEQNKRPSDSKLREKLINKAREIGEARFKK